MPNPASNPATTAPQPAVLARMFNGLTEGVAIVEGAFGKNGWVIAHSNPALSKLSGYAPAELQKMTHGKLHKDRSDLDAMRRWAIQGADAAPLAQEGYLKRKDDTTLFVAWTLSALVDDAGNLTQVMITY
ncbi:MAG: hypothetical protein ACKVI3_13505 [Verrucomicrobiia bacterium]